MHIWLTIPSLSTKVGGPAIVVQNLSDYLASLGASVSVLTSEPDRGHSELLPRDRRVNVVHVPGKGRGPGQSAFGGQFQETLGRCLQSQNGDVVHDFGLWLPAHHAVACVCKTLGIPLVCSTSGMLAPWALRHKAWKKRLAWWLYQRRDLSCAALLAATSEQEVGHIRRLVPGKNIALVPNGVEFPAVSVEPRRATGNQPRKAVFLGRIHPVKGLKNLVEAWHITRPDGWRCILAGPDEAGHQKELEAILRLRKLENTFEFPGMMDNEQKWALLNDADLFILPSFTENFGIAVAEALACAVPVITTKGAPWQDLVDHHCGWWVDVGVEPLAEALRNATILSDDERRQMGERARQLVQGKYSWDRIARDTNSVYSWLLGAAAKPPCVYNGEP
jgi:glycosyltransferase involved in cell wall biosynthesis